MKNRSRTLSTLLACALFFPVSASLISDEWKLSNMVGSEKGGAVYRAKPVDKKYLNPWPESYEREFQARARRIIAAQPEKLARGTTFFESEKRFYGVLMAQALGEHGLEAIEVLQGEDHQAEDWHRHTDGIDYFACFTLKHQMRKYFYFGDLLDPAYKKRMFSGAKKWTGKDPYNRPHHAFKNSQGWGPDAKNSWVDVRNTENLFLMRVTSVYLMAEETGNKETTAIYKKIILDYAKTLFRIGIGEWDSENYHGHSVGPLCNLYDFARDPEVKLAAKACLDWFMTAGAVKYYRGGFNGPGSRDYNHAQPFGGSAAGMLWVYFGDTPKFNEEHLEGDEVHLITSAYRPPVAVMKLARKEFKKPLEIYSSKPEYDATTTGRFEGEPAYFETHYFGDSFQFGSLSCGTPPGFSSVNGFKILVRDEKEGSLALHAAPTSDPNFAGSPLYQKGKVTAENRVAHYENLAVWLAKDGGAPWLWVVPDSFDVSKKGDVMFIECGETWLGVRPLGCGAFARDDKKTQLAVEGKGSRFAGHGVYSTKGSVKGFCGFAVEIGEKQSHKSFSEFQKQVLEAEVDLSKLEEGIVQYRASDGKALGFHWQDDPANLGVWRNGKRHDWVQHGRFLYTNAEPEEAAPVQARWGQGILYVEAGGEGFLCEVDGEGGVAFDQGSAAEMRKKYESRSEEEVE